jgi:MFS family permease
MQSNYFLCLLLIFVDRWNRHRILVTTQILAMIQSLALAVLALTGIIQIWHIILLSIFQGFINAFDAPARQAFVTEMIEKKEDLGNAIALNSSMFNGARLVGPAMAGLVIASVGAGMCFLIDGLSYIAVIASLLAMKLKPRQITVQTTNVWQRLKEGFIYAFSFPPIRAILLLLALFSFMGMPYMVLIPIFATKILDGDAETLGFLMTASGLGALMGGIYLSSRQSVVGLGKVIAFSPAVLGVGLIIFSQSRLLWLSLLMMLFVGEIIMIVSKDKDIFELPGPTGNSLVGSLIDLGQDPLGFLTKCAREYGDIVPLHLGLTSACLVRNPEYIEEILKDRETFIKSRGLRALRSLLGEGLLSSGISGYGEVMVAYAEQMLNTWQDGETRNIHADIYTGRSIFYLCIFPRLKITPPCKLAR